MARVGFIQDELDLKLLVLYIMDRVAAPVTFVQLLDLALCDAGVDYFSLTQVVNHLVETEHLSLENDRYDITEKGRHNSQICESSLPYSVRRHCAENLIKVNDTLRREQQVRASLTPHADGTCTVHLYFSDDNGPLMDMQLHSPTCARGDAVVARFKKTPEQLYHRLMDVLNGGN